MLVVSVDAHNRSRMRDVVCVGVYEGDLTEQDASPYAAVVAVEGQEWTVFLDDLFVVAKDELADLRWAAPPELLSEAQDALREILTPAAATSTSPIKPVGYPRTNEVRFADLRIPGEQAKPVVVISSEEYGRLVEHAFVVACRVSSDTVKIRAYDVALRSQNGKVVCSHVQSVRLADITFRTTPGAAHVSAKEGEEIRGRVFALLGL